MDSVSFPAVAKVAHHSVALETLHGILEANDIETVWALITSHMRGLGFAGVIYGYSPDSRGIALGDVEDMLLLATLERGFLTELVGKRHYTNSVTFSWALANTGIASFTMTPEEAGLKDFAYRPESLAFFARHGIDTGFSIGFAPLRARGRGVMSVIGAPGSTQQEIDAMLDARRGEIFVVASVAHRAMVSMPYSTARKLTPRQREVLEWLAQGKSVANVAVIMNIAMPTVEKHLRLAREALGVETTAHALMKAAFLNQMFMPGDTRG
jgi:DNA-binding CsgD family transcriptional regulator